MLPAPSSINGTCNSKPVQFPIKLEGAVQPLLLVQFCGKAQRSINGLGSLLRIEHTCWDTVLIQFHQTSFIKSILIITQNFNSLFVQEGLAIQVGDEDRFVRHGSIYLVQGGLAFFFELEFIPPPDHLYPGAFGGPCRLFL